MGHKTGARWLFWILALFLTGGCSPLYMKSTWLNHDLVLNGDVKDWPGGVNPLYGEKISMGASNNGDFLFLALVIRDSTGGVYTNYSHSIAAKGLTAWIDPHGEDARRFGIRLMGMEDPDSNVLPGASKRLKRYRQRSSVHGFGGEPVGNHHRKGKYHQNERAVPASIRV